MATGLKERITGAALCVALLFSLAFPYPGGFVKPQRAEAVVPIAVPIILGTVAAAGGVFVAGATASQYDANLNALYQGFGGATSQWTSSWQTYVQDKGSFDNAMQSLVTSDGNISLQQVQDAGLWDSLHSYTVYCVDHGTMVSGASSASANTSYYDVGGVSINVGLGEVPASFYSGCESLGFNSSNLIAWTRRPSDGNMTFLLSDSSQLFVSSVYDDHVTLTVRATMRVDGTTGRASLGGNATQSLYSGSSWVKEGISITQNNQAVSSVNGQSGEAVVSADSYAGTLSYPTSTVQPFEPTAEQLAQGYDASAIVEAIESGNQQTAASLDSILSALTGAIGGTLEGIRQGVEGIETSVGAAVGSAVAGIATGITAVGDTLGDIWGDLSDWWTDWLAWAGSTPIGRLIADVIAALNSGVLTLQQAITAVQTAVGTAVTDLVGAIEAVGELIPTGGGQSGEGSQGGESGEPVSVPPFLPTSEPVNNFAIALTDKAPFAYVAALSEAVADASSTFSSAPNFYFEVQIPYVEGVTRFDAGPWLNYEVGGLSVAYYIRILLTASLCVGMLVFMYKVAVSAMEEHV